MTGKPVLLALAMALLLSAVAACSGNNNKNGESASPSASNAPSASASSSESAPAASEPAKEPVTLKISALVATAEPSGVMSNPVAKYIEEKLGITMDMTPISDADWTEKLNALIASNDLPDIFPINDAAKQLPQLVKAGQIIPLDDLVAQYGKHLNADPLAQAMLEVHKKTVSPDGNLYTIGMARGTWDGGTQPLVGNYIRWDLYKQLGYPALNNFDTDLLNVLAEMQKLEPTNKDGQKVYAIGGWFAEGQGWGDWQFTNTLLFTEGKPYLTGDRTTYYDIATNNVSEQNDLLDKNGQFWRTVQFYNKAYQMGILDPEAFTQKYDQYVEKLNSGRYLYNTPGWVVTDANKNFETAGTPEKGFVALPALNTDTFNLVNMMPLGERTFVISKNAKHPERAMELLDFLSSYEGAMLVWNGVEGMNYTMEGGKPVPSDEFVNSSSGDNEYMKKTGAGFYHHFVGYAGGTINPETNTPFNLRDYSEKAMAKNLRPVHQDMLQHYGKSNLYELYTSGVKAFQNNGIYSLGELPENLKTQGTNMQAYQFKNLFKLIQAKTDGDFAKLQDDFIAGLAEFQTDEIFDYWKTKAKQQKQDLQNVYDLLNQ